MTLKVDIQKTVQKTMQLLAGFDLAVKIDYYHVTGTSYNPSTGTPSSTETEYANKTAVLTTFSSDEKTEDVVVITDRKALIAFTDLPIIVTNNDYLIERKTGVRWEVKKVMGFPGDPMHKLHVRKV